MSKKYEDWATPSLTWDAKNRITKTYVQLLSVSIRFSNWRADLNQFVIRNEKKFLSQRKNTCKRCRRRIKDIESKWSLKHQNSFSESQILKTSSRVEMHAPVVILAWRKYELHNFAMRSTYVLSWFPYVNRVSLNIYEHMQHYIHPIWTPISLVTSSSNDMNAVMWCL